MLSFAIFVNYKIYQSENFKAEQISSLESFINKNPLFINKPIFEYEMQSFESPKQILITFEKFMQNYPDLKLKSLSLTEKEENSYLVSLSIESTFENYINFIDDLSLKSPVTSDFPFVVEINTYKLDVPSLDSNDSSNFKSTFLIHTL
tara:strand:- start:551 stop:994 length:444 start_codon:yes stop_codon:yes gene_type:complete